MDSLFSGDINVLISANSFSSSIHFAALLSDNNLSTVDGEIPGNMPTSYGDILYFQTPNANLIFTVSYKYFIRLDSSKADLPLIPDIQVPADNVMEGAIPILQNYIDEFLYIIASRGFRQY